MLDFCLQGYAPPPKNGVEQKRPGRPLNITSLVRLSSAVPNQISVTWAPEIGKVREEAQVGNVLSMLMFMRCDVWRWRCSLNSQGCNLDTATHTLLFKGTHLQSHRSSLISEAKQQNWKKQQPGSGCRDSQQQQPVKEKLTVDMKQTDVCMGCCRDTRLYLMPNISDPHCVWSVSVVIISVTMRSINSWSRLSHWTSVVPSCYWCHFNPERVFDSCCFTLSMSHAVFVSDLLHVCVLGEAADVSPAPAKTEDEGHQEPRPLQSTE